MRVHINTLTVNVEPGETDIQIDSVTVNLPAGVVDGMSAGDITKLVEDTAEKIAAAIGAIIAERGAK